MKQDTPHGVESNAAKSPHAEKQTGAWVKNQTMRTTSTSLKFALEQTDFTIVNGMKSITLLDTVDFSFGKDGMLMIPSSEKHIIQNGRKQVAYAFTDMPDSLYLHRPMTGNRGRSLPLAEALIQTGMMSTDKTLSPPLTPPRIQPQEQTDNLPVPEDDTFTKVLVAGNLAYEKGSLPPSSTAKMPQNNQKRHNATVFFRTDSSRKSGTLTVWAKPVAVRAQILDGEDWLTQSRKETVIADFGGRLLFSGWNDEDGRREEYEGVDGGKMYSSIHVDGLGYQYGHGNGYGNEALVYRDVDGEWSDEPIEYAIHVDTWFLRDAFNADRGRRYGFRARYALGLDENGREIWRGWSPIVFFTTNTAPLPPTRLRLHTASGQ